MAELLPHVSVGSPHSDSHNDERDAINTLKQQIETLVIDPLEPTDAQIAFEIANGTQTPAALQTFLGSAGNQLPSYVSPSVTGRYDSARSVYNWKASNTRKLRAGLGRAMCGGQAEHLVIGDSFSAGNVQGAVAPYVFSRDQAWARTAQRELGRHGVVEGGTGWVRVNDNNLGQPLGWTFTGANWNHTAKAYSATTVGGQYASFTPQEGGYAYSHYWYDPGTGGGTYPFSIEIDGVVLAASITSVTGAARFRVSTVISPNPIIAGESVIKITAGANGHYLAAGKVWNPAQGGLQISNIAQSGSRAYSTAASQSDRWDSLGAGGLGEVYKFLATQVRQVTDGSVTASSTTLTSASGNFTIDDVGKPLSTPAGGSGLTLPENTYIQAILSSTTVQMSQAALRTASGLTIGIGRNIDFVWLELGGNDLSNGVTAANIKTALTNIRNRYPNSEVGLMSIHQPANSLIVNATFDAYVGELYKLADTFDCPLIDLRDRFGTYSDMVNNDLLGDSSVHPLTPVYTSVGRMLGQLMAA